MPKSWVIPDIHGCINTLRELIENRISISKEDNVYFLGDYIDRGTNSKAVLDYIMNLEAEGYNITALMGNHEDYFLRAWEEATQQKKRSIFFGGGLKITKEWLKHGGQEMLSSFNTDDPLQIPQHYVDWLKQRPYYVQLDKFILVHAGLNFKKDDPFEDKTAMLWIREYDIIPEKIGNRKIIHGHVPVKLDLIEESITLPHYKFIDLDNGCIYKNLSEYGNLTALELNTMSLVIQPNID